MKKFKRVGSICLSIAFMLSISMSAYASDNGTEKQPISKEVILTTTQEERDAEFERVMEDIQAHTATPYGPKYRYKTEYLPYSYTTLSGYAGNQVAGGYKFPTGGGFWFSDVGGPTVSGSVSLSLPAPFNIVSVSVNLGQKGDSGVWVSAPTTTAYYKLYVSKVMELRSYIVYRAPVGTENWEVDNAGTVPITYSVTASARKV